MLEIKWVSDRIVGEEQEDGSFTYNFNDGEKATNVESVGANLPFFLAATLEWERVANVDFQHKDAADPSFDGWTFMLADIEGAYGKVNYEDKVLFINKSFAEPSSGLDFGLGYETILHELGHILLGVKHFGALGPESVMRTSDSAPFVLTPSILDIHCKLSNLC